MQKKTLGKILLLLLVTCTGVAEAIELTIPTSIHNILEPAQINELKHEVKNIKSAMRTKMMIEAIIKLSVTNQEMLDSFFPEVSPYPDIATMKSFEKTIMAEMGGEIMSLIKLETAQKLKFRDPFDPDGLAVRLAPSDDELF